MLGESTENLLRGYRNNYHDVGADVNSGTTARILQKYFVGGGRPIGPRIPQSYNGGDGNGDGNDVDFVGSSRQDRNLGASLDVMSDIIAQRLRDIDMSAGEHKDESKSGSDTRDQCEQDPGINVSPDQYDNILSHLYSRLREYLLGNNMSLSFLELLRNYIANLIESGVDPFKNRYLLEIQNELLSPLSLESGRNGRIDAIMKKFLIEPDDIIMKLTLVEYNRKQNTQRKYLLRWKLGYDLRLVINKSYHFYLKLQKGKKFQLWRRKFKQVTVREQSVALKANEYRLLYAGFEKWLFRYDMLHRENERADRQFLISKFAQIVKKWKLLHDAELKITAKTRERCLRLMFNKWALKIRESKFNPLGLPKKYLEKLKTKRQIHNKMQAQAILFRELSLKTRVLRSLRLRYIEIATKQQQLDKLEDKFLTNRGFQMYLRNFRLREREHHVIKMLDEILLRFVLRKLWVRQFRSNIRCSTLQSRQDDRIKLRYFTHLKKSLFLNLRASQFAKTRLLRSTFQAWRRHERFNVWQTIRQREILREYLTRWELRRQLHERYKYFQLNMTKKASFQKWSTRRRNEAKNESLAIHMYSLNLQKSFLLKLTIRLYHIFKMDAKCLLFQRMKAMRVLQNGFKHTRLIQARCLSTNTASIKTPTLRRYLSLWRTQARLKKKFKLKNRFDVCREQRNIRLKRRLLNLMMKRYRFYRWDLSKRASLLADKNLKKRYFHRLLNKLEVYSIRSQLSTQVHNDTVLHNTLSSWVGKLNSIQQLEATYSSAVIQHNLRILSEILSTWSMKLLRVSRNQESVQMFRQRWDRAVLRGLLLLWRVKWQNLHSRRDGAAIPLINNKKDSNNNNNGNTDSYNGDTYLLNLTTPARSLVSDDSTIPGSVSMRRTKMEAVINRYRRAGRAIPSPIKSSSAFKGTGVFTENSTDDQGTRRQPHSRPRFQTHLTWSIPTLRPHSPTNTTTTTAMTPSVSTTTMATQPRVRSNSIKKRIDFENILELKPDAAPVILPPVQIRRGTTKAHTASSSPTTNLKSTSNQ